MFRKRSASGGSYNGYGITPPSVNPYDELNNILAKAENKRRKLTPEYITPYSDQQQGINSIQRVLGLNLGDLFTNTGKPPPEDFADVGQQQGLENPGDDLDNKPVDGDDSKTQMPVHSGHGSDTLELITNNNNNGTVILDSTKPYKPGDTIQTDYTLDEVVESTPTQTDFTLDEVVQTESPPPSQPAESNDAVKVQSVKDASGKEHYYVFDETTGYWYNVTFMEGLIDESDGVFLFQGILYMNNGTNWVVYQPDYDPNNTGTIPNVTSLEIDTNGNYNLEITDPYSGTVYYLHLVPNENGMVTVFGEEYYYNEHTNSFVTDPQQISSQRENLLKLIAQTYGLTGSQSFMLYHFAEYYETWNTLWPGVMPVPQEIFEVEIPYMKELQTLLFNQGPDALASFMADNPLYSIAYGLLFPSSLDPTNSAMSIILQQYEYYQSLSEENGDRQLYSQLMELTWALNTPSVNQYISGGINEELGNFIQLMNSNPNDENYTQRLNESFIQLLTRTISIFSADASPIAGVIATIPFDVSLDFAMQQIMVLSAYYGFNIQMPSSVGGFVLQSLQSYFIGRVENGASPLADLLSVGLQNVPFKEVSAAMQSAFNTGFKNAVQYLLSRMGVNIDPGVFESESPMEVVQSILRYVFGEEQYAEWATFLESTSALESDIIPSLLSEADLASVAAGDLALEEGFAADYAEANAAKSFGVMFGEWLASKGVTIPAGAIIDAGLVSAFAAGASIATEYSANAAAGLAFVADAIPLLMVFASVFYTEYYLWEWHADQQKQQKIYRLLELLWIEKVKLKNQAAAASAASNGTN